MLIWQQSFEGILCFYPLASPEFCSMGARACGARVPKFVVTKSSRSESHMALCLQKRIWLKIFATACHSNWWLWRSNFELTELDRKISTAMVWTAAKFACIRKLQGARAPVTHAWRHHCFYLFTCAAVGGLLSSLVGVLRSSRRVKMVKGLLDHTLTVKVTFDWLINTDSRQVGNASYSLR